MLVAAGLGLAAWAACTVNTLEELPGLEVCAYDDGSGASPQRVTLEVGRIDGDTFVPFVDGDEVELAPWPYRDLPGGWAALLAIRLKDLPSGVTGGCFHLTGGSGEGFEFANHGYVLEQLPGGDVVARVVTYNVSQAAAGSFDDWLGTSTPFIVGGRATTNAGLLFADEVRVSLAVVNHQGFLAPRPPDAGTPDPTNDGGTALEPDFQAFLLIRQPRLHPGEASDVELSVVGERAGLGVTFEKFVVTGTILVLDRNDLAGDLSDEDARVTNGQLGIHADAVPGDYVQEVVVRSNDGRYSASASYGFTVLPPE